jgi:hypothetical protein
MARVEAGKVYLIIGSAHGPKGPSVGRKCKTMWLHGHEHSLHGPIWHVASVDGKEFLSEHGGIGMEVDVAEDWLQEVPPEPPKAEPRVTEKDLERVE